MPRPALRRAHADEEARPHLCRPADTGAGDRREYGDLFGGQCRAVAPAAVRAARTAGLRLSYAAADPARPHLAARLPGVAGAESVVAKKRRLHLWDGQTDRRRSSPALTPRAPQRRLLHALPGEAGPRAPSSALR